MNRSGEIRRLSAIAGPTVGLITNIGPAHLEGLGSLQAISRAKAELFEALTREDWAVINQDDPRILELSTRCPGSENHLRAGPRGRSPGRSSPPRLLRARLSALRSGTKPGDPAATPRTA